MSQSWYYAKGDHKHGPITSAELKAHAMSGELKPSDLVWTEGMADWKAVSSIKGLLPQEPPLAGPPPLPSSSRGFKTGDLRAAGVSPVDRLKTAAAAASTTPAGSSTKQGPTPTRIGDLPVSDTWKQRFRAIENDPDRQGFGSFNVLAFFFGPFYYAAKGLWKKGLVLALAGMVLSTILERLLAAFGGSLPTQVQWMPAGALCATMANRDVYLKEIRGERFWPSLDRLERPIPLIALTIASLMFVTLLTPSSPSDGTVGFTPPPPDSVAVGESGSSSKAKEKSDELSTTGSMGILKSETGDDKPSEEEIVNVLVLAATGVALGAEDSDRLSNTPWVEIGPSEFNNLVRQAAAMLGCGKNPETRHLLDIEPSEIEEKHGLTIIYYDKKKYGRTFVSFGPNTKNGRITFVGSVIGDTAYTPAGVVRDGKLVTPFGSLTVDEFRREFKKDESQ